MKLTQSVPLNLIHQVAHHNELTTWIRIHALYPKSIVYNFNYAALSAKTGISHTTLRKHIKSMLSLRWCYLRDGNLCFVGLNKLSVVYLDNGKAKDAPLIPVKVCATKKAQVLELRAVIIKGNLLKQKKRIEHKTELLKKATSKEGKLKAKDMRSITKAGGLEKFARSIVQYTTLSNKKFGLLISRSNSTGRRLQKSLSDSKIINSTTNIVVVKNNVSGREFAEFSYHNPQPFYIYDMKGSKILKQLSNKVELCEGIVDSQNLYV